MTTAFRIPDRLAHIVVSAFGDVGRDWLARLPSLVADAACAWQLEVGAPFEPGGNVGWVAPVRRADGSDAVLKVECPGHRNPWAAKGLQHWAGRGAARLFDSDEATQVLLLERCVPGTNGGDLDVATGTEIVVSVLAELHAVDPPAEDEFEPLAMFVERIRETMRDRFDRFERAGGSRRRRARGRAVLVPGLVCYGHGVASRRFWTGERGALGAWVVGD